MSVSLGALFPRTKYGLIEALEIQVLNFLHIQQGAVLCATNHYWCKKLKQTLLQKVDTEAQKELVAMRHFVTAPLNKFQLMVSPNHPISFIYQGQSGFYVGLKGCTTTYNRTIVDLFFSRAMLESHRNSETVEVTPGLQTSQFYTERSLAVFEDQAYFANAAQDHIYITKVSGQTLALVNLCKNFPGSKLIACTPVNLQQTILHLDKVGFVLMSIANKKTTFCPWVFDPNLYRVFCRGEYLYIQQRKTHAKSWMKPSALRRSDLKPILICDEAHPLALEVADYDIVLSEGVCSIFDKITQALIVRRSLPIKKGTEFWHTRKVLTFANEEALFFWHIRTNILLQRSLKGLGSVRSVAITSTMDECFIALQQRQTHVFNVSRYVTSEARKTNKTGSLTGLKWCSL